MQLESLKIFCDVVRWASFSRGASENGISQSSASQAVHQLEVRLGVKLIDRSKRPLVTTPEGQLYYEGCREILGRYLELEGRVRAFVDEQKVVGTVGIASIYSVGLHHMTRFVKDFEEQFPEANVRLEYLHPARVLERVISGDVDLGLISYPRKWPELHVIPWRVEDMVLAVHPSHRLAQEGRSSVHVRELEGEAFIGFDPDLSIRKATDRFLRQHGVEVEIVLEFDNIENLKRAVEIPAGISILPEPTLSHELKSGALVAIRLDGDDPSFRLTRPLAIVHRRHQNLDRPASRFLELLLGGAERATDPPSAASSSRESASTHSRRIPAPM
jgi:DNA-binding transcriptional LysR family regulator